jgi:tripartite-type tricarboxylate transporter receptor subunit TctC
MFRSKRILFSIVALLAMSSILSTNVYAAYPDKPIVVVVPWSAGGPSDIVARTTAKYMQKYLPQPLAVLNIVGAGGVLGCQEVNNAKPDGYKILLHQFSMHVAYDTGTADFDYDAFTPIVKIGGLENAYAVNASSPWKTIEELIKYAKEHPDKKIKFGCSIGATSHLDGVGLAEGAGIKFDYIPVDGAAKQIAALMGKHIDLMCSELGQMMQYQKSGDFRLLAVDAEKRNIKMAPEIPTLKEKGINFAMGQVQGIFAPKGVSKEVISVLSSAFKKLAADQAYVNDLFNMVGLGVEYLGPEEYSKALRNYSDTIGNLV